MKESMTKERFMQELVVGMVGGDGIDCHHNTIETDYLKARASFYWHFARAIVEVGEEGDK